jgi:hypothetical protein
MADGLQVHQIPGLSGIAVDALAETRVIADVVREAHADDDAAQHLAGGVAHGVCPPSAR